MAGELSQIVEPMSTEQDTLSTSTFCDVLCAKCERRILPTRSHSPVPLDIFRSNHAPSKVDISQTMEILQEEEQELNAYDEEIQRLLADREKLCQKREMRQSWLAPIRRLPTEVLGRIFNEVVQMSDYSLYVGIDSRRTDPYGFPPLCVTAPALPLSHVSSYWRNLALSQKSMWSSIHLELNQLIRKDLSTLLRVYLSNATGHPLRIKLAATYYGLKEPSPSEFQVRDGLGQHMFHLLQMVANRFSGCGELVANLRYPEVLLYAVNTKISFPLLHSLVCDSQPIFPRADPEQGSGIPTNFLFWDAVREAPLLRNVQFDEVGQSRYQGYIPWEQLTSLSASCLYSYTDFRFILSRSKCLEVLCVGLSQGNDTITPSHNDIEPISLPYLWKVDLFNSTPKETHYALASLTAPSLRDICVSVYRNHRLQVNEVAQSWDMGSLYSMIDRSSCNLTRLNLSVPFPFGIWGESFALFVEILRSSESLECLEVRTGTTFKANSEAESSEPGDSGSKSLLGSIFSVLAVSSSSGPILLPRLRDIHIHEPISASVQVMDSILDTVGERTATSLRGVTALDRFGNGDICPLANVVIGIKTASRCWTDKSRDFFRSRAYGGSSIPLGRIHEAKLEAAMEDRLDTFEKDETKCVIIPEFRF